LNNTLTKWRNCSILCPGFFYKWSEVMGIQSASWEYRLLSWAHEGLISPSVDNQIEPEAEILNSAYDYCARITRTNSRTFYMASILLPKDKRQAVQALYAFCRSTDDLVDETRGLTEAEAVFADWRTRLSNPHPSAHDPVPLAWAQAQARYRIPGGYADQLINGVTRDRTQKRYSSFDELTEYCYGVASTVGLMSMHIVGFESQDAIPYAVKLGIALQLTNILRDIGEDWQLGRLYLPLEEMAGFGLAESDIAEARVDGRWRAFMRFQIDRVRRLYVEAAPGIALLNADGRFAIAAAAGLYSAILDDIETHDYDVFHRSAHIGLSGKLKRLPGIWWNSRS
jgi:15-cis-phytoene synthase